MGNPFIRLLLIAMSVVCLATTLARANKEEVVYARVQSVNIQLGQLTVVTVDDDTKVLQVPSALLKGLRPGDDVDIEIANGKIKSIYNWNDKSASVKGYSRWTISTGFALKYLPLFTSYRMASMEIWRRFYTG